MISFDEALRTVMEDVHPAHRRRIPHRVSLSPRIRTYPVLATPVVAPFDMPAFDRSAVDGYGVRTGDEGPRRVVGEVAAGDDPSRVSIAADEAVRLFTGSGIPAGVDAVVMQEDVRHDGGWIVVDGEIRLGSHIRRRGAEALAGAELLPAGTVANPPVIALLASLGIPETEVWAAPHVTIVTTGNELAASGEKLRPGQVYECLGISLTTAMYKIGLSLVNVVRAPDDPAQIYRVLRDALNSEIVITTGGVSVGDHDLVRPTFDRLNVEQRIWGVAMRPGKPFYYGVGPRGQRVFGLPGNPVSALVTWHTLVRPVLMGLLGRAPEPPIQLALDVSNEIGRIGDRDSFLCACVKDGRVCPEGAQESHMLTGLARAGGLIRLRAGSGPYVQGDMVEVLPIRW